MMVASCVVYLTDSQIAKYVDPIFAIISAISLFILSYPYSKYIQCLEKYRLPKCMINIYIINSTFFISFCFQVKESGMILLQTIPNHINIESLQKDLLAAFPDIVNVHDLHVWQLNGEKVVSTVHIIYADPTVIRHAPIIIYTLDTPTMALIVRN